ncbi:putative glutaredoxin Grx5 [Atractiella rhizophila]|nr:putative glutaredoxin Grx5 [Atractiella rhizophila]
MSFFRPSLLQTQLLVRAARSHPTSLRFLSSSTRQTLDNVIKGTPAVLFMKGTPTFPQCGFSRAVCQVLELNGVDAAVMKDKSLFKHYNVLDDDELRQAVKEYSDWPTIPQLYLGGEFVGGADIAISMHQSGEMREALQKAGVVKPVLEGEVEVEKEKERPTQADDVKV